MGMTRKLILEIFLFLCVLSPVFSVRQTSLNYQVKAEGCASGKCVGARAGSSASREAGGALTELHGSLTGLVSLCALFLKMRTDEQCCRSWVDWVQGVLRLCLAFPFLSVVLVLKAAVDS